MAMSEPSGTAPEQPALRTPNAKSIWLERGILSAVCLLVIAIYVCAAHEGALTQPSLNPDGSYYNLLVQGFRAGQLNLKKEVSSQLAQLPDPYTWSALRPAGLMDLSYYKGKLYLYFGPTPAVLLFWPYTALTGQYLSSKDAVIIFCVAGFLISMGLSCAIWRRHFADVSVWVMAAGTLALGLAPFLLPLLARCDVYEVAIGCAYALKMAALAAIWKALNGRKRRAWWLAGASLAYGLAVGARPNLLFGAVVLFVPVIQAWRERRRFWPSLLAASFPISFIGLGLMLYNVRRFDDPLEFGTRYLLTTRSYFGERLFGLRNLWLNFRVYFLEPARWNGRFPFVHRNMHLADGGAFGVLTNVPLSWLGLASSLAWRGQSGATRSASDLRWFVIATALLFALCALPLGLYSFVAIRYQVNFLPELVLLAVIGIFSLERLLASQPSRRIAVRWGYGFLLAFSVAFNLLASVQHCAEAKNDLGMQLQQAGRTQEAIRQFAEAVFLYPDLADAYVNLGNAEAQLGRLQEAVGDYERALRIKPSFSKAHNDFGIVLARLGRLPEAIDQWEQALQIDPDLAETHNNLGIALKATGSLPEAMAHWEQALRINPDLAEPHNNLGIAFRRLGRLPEAINHWEQALRIKPDLAEAHYNLGVALMEAGNSQEAVAHLKQATQLQPNDPESHYNLGAALADTGDLTGAIAQFEEALRLKPDYAEAQRALDSAHRGEMSLNAKPPARSATAKHITVSRL
jgi:tetratricopeptide (TPR) repeat protein